MVYTTTPVMTMRRIFLSFLALFASCVAEATDREDVQEALSCALRVAKEVASKYGVSHSLLDVITLDRTYVAPFYLLEALAQAPNGSIPIATAALTLPTGNQALACRLLKRDELYEARLDKFLAEFAQFLPGEKQPSRAQIDHLFRALETNRQLVSEFQVLDAVYQRIFATKELLYKKFAFSPYLFPYFSHLRFYSNESYRESSQAALTHLASPSQTLFAELGEHLKSIQEQRLLLKIHQTLWNDPERTPGFRKQITYEDLGRGLGLDQPKQDPRTKLTLAVDRLLGQHSFSDETHTYSLSEILRHPSFAAGSEGLYLLVSGLEQAGWRKIDEGLENLNRDHVIALDPKARTEIFRLLGEASRNPQVYEPVTELKFGRNVKNASINEIFYMQMEQPYLPLLILTGGMQVPLFSFRFQQVEMAKVLAQYGAAESGENVLEFGYGFPSILGLSKLIFPQAGLSGVDPAPMPEDTVNFLKSLGIDLFAGTVPKDQAVAERLEKKGKNSVVFGVDVFRPTYGGWGRDFDPEVPVERSLKWIYDNMTEGGIFAMLNDNKAPPYYSREQLEAAGFKIVRWEEERILPFQQKLMLPTAKDHTHGDMVLYLVRKGEELVPKSVVPLRW